MQLLFKNLDGALAKLVREVPKGEWLFRQGEMGNTLLVVVDGKVALTQRVGNLSRLMETIGPGEILGERAITSDKPEKRAYGAQARTDTVVLELDAEAYSLVQSRNPGFTSQILRLVTTRLEKAHELVAILQIRGEVQRFVEYLRYCVRHHGERVPQGTVVAIAPDAIAMTLNIDLTLAADCLQALLTNRTVVAAENGYLIADENTLLAQLATLQERFGA